MHMNCARQNGAIVYFIIKITMVCGSLILRYELPTYMIIGKAANITQYSANIYKNVDT